MKGRMLWRVAVAAILATATIITTSLAFTGNCGIWAVKAGDFVAKNFSGDQTGLNAAVSYVGTAGTIGVNPGCSGLTWPTLPAGVTITRQEGGIDYKYGTQIIQPKTSGGNFAFPLQLVPPSGTSSALLTEFTDAAYPDHTYPSSSHRGIWNLNVDITKASGFFRNFTNCLEVRGYNHSVNSLWYAALFDIYGAIPNGAPDSTGNVITRGTQTHARGDGANNNWDNIIGGDFSAEITNTNTATSMVAVNGGVLLNPSHTANGSGKAITTIGLNSFSPEMADSANVHIDVNAAGGIVRGSAVCSTCKGWVDDWEGVRIGPPQIVEGGTINSSAALRILDPTGSGVSGNKISIEIDGGDSYTVGKWGIGTASMPTAAVHITQPTAGTVGQAIIGASSATAAWATIKSGSDSLWTIGPGTTTANVAAHLRVKQGTAPTSAAGSNNTGTGNTVTITSGSTDAAGSVSIGIGSTATAGPQATITFRSRYGAAPKAVLITHSNGVGAYYGWYVTNVGTASFDISTANNPPTGNTVTFYYWVIE